MEKDFLLGFIDLFYGLEHAHGISILLCSLDKSLDIFWETASTISTTRIQEFATDTAIGSHSLANHVHIGSDKFTKIGNVVHETDSGCKHGIRCILNYLS